MIVGVLVIGAALNALGCAYFNTFYNAREHFKKAERINEAQVDSRRDVDVAGGGRTTVTGSASREYDLTIEKCNKVIQNHGGSRWVDDAILLMGRAYLGKLQYREALNKFATLVNEFTDSDLHTEARYFLGVTYYRLGRDEEGRQTFEKLLADKPKFKRRDDILATQAEAFIEAGEVGKGAATYRRILSEFDNRERRVQTLLRLGEIYMNESAFDSAYAAYEEVANSADKMTVRLDARERRADALTREERYEDALSGYLEVLDLGTTLSADRVAPIKLKVAASRLQIGQTESALSEYEEVREAYPNSQHAAEATFEIGRIYELYVGDYEKAIEVYREIDQIRGVASQSLFVSQARTRADKLARLVELGVTGADAKAEGESDAEARFLLAEQFLFQESDTLRSWINYYGVATTYPDTQFGRSARYGLAWIALKRDAEADSTLSRLVDVLVEYPGTPQALQVGDLLTARGREDLIPPGSLTVVEPDSTRAGTVDDDGSEAVTYDVQPASADSSRSPIDVARAAAARRDSLRRIAMERSPGLPGAFDGQKGGRPEDE